MRRWSPADQASMAIRTIWRCLSRQAVSIFNWNLKAILVDVLTAAYNAPFTAHCQLQLATATSMLPQKGQNE